MLQQMGKKHVYLLNMSTLMLRASCLTLEINDLDVMERKLAAARSRTQESNPGHLSRGLRWLVIIRLLWLSAEHWGLKPEVSWVRLPVAAGLFTFLYFTS